MKTRIERVLVAYPRGFCGGVKRAINIFDNCLLYGTKVYGYHELVHNKYVITNLEDRGATFVDDIDKIPYNSTVVFSAHGVSPEIREKARERSLKAVDATCHLVKKVHDEVSRFASMDYKIVLIGQKGHDEVVGTMGEAPDRVWIIENIEDIGKLPYWNEKVACVTQTTLNVDETTGIVKSLKSRYPFIEGPSKDDICYATKARQDAIKNMVDYSPRPDLILILGSANSSNTKKLLQIAQDGDIESLRIDTIKEIKESLFEDRKVVGLSSGASVPESVIEEAVDFFKGLGVSADAISDFKLVNEKIKL